MVACTSVSVKRSGDVRYRVEGGKIVEVEDGELLILYSPDRNRNICKLVYSYSNTWPARDFYEWLYLEISRQGSFISRIGTSWILSACFHLYVRPLWSSSFSSFSNFITKRGRGYFFLRRGSCYRVRLYFTSSFLYFTFLYFILLSLLFFLSFFLHLSLLLLRFLFKVVW